MNLAELNKVARAMTSRKAHSRRRRILGTIKKRFDAIKRRIDRGQPPRLSRDAVPLHRGDEQAHLGVILYDETIWQNAKDGTPLVKLIEQAGSIPASRSTKARKPLPNCPGELVTVGLDKLAERLQKILRARRALREVARGDRYRRRAFLRRPPSTSTRMRWRAMPRCARRRRSYRSSSRKC